VTGNSQLSELFIHQHQHQRIAFRRRGLERLFGHSGNGARFAGATAPPVLLASALPEAGSFAGRSPY